MDTVILRLKSYIDNMKRENTDISKRIAYARTQISNEIAELVKNESSIAEYEEVIYILEREKKLND